MNTLDIILLVLLLIAAVAGWRKGIIVQACGIAGLVLGILFAMRFSRTIGGWLGAGEELSPVLGFVVILVVSILVLALIGYLFKKVFRLTGFGIIDRLGGLALSVVKIGMLLAVLTGFFARMNDNYHWVKPETISDSVIYLPGRGQGEDFRRNAFAGRDETGGDGSPTGITEHRIWRQES